MMDNRKGKAPLEFNNRSGPISPIPMRQDLVGHDQSDLVDNNDVAMIENELAYPNGIEINQQAIDAAKFGNGFFTIFILIHLGTQPRRLSLSSVT